MTMLFEKLGVSGIALAIGFGMVYYVAIPVINSGMAEFFTKW